MKFTQNHMGLDNWDENPLQMVSLTLSSKHCKTQKMSSVKITPSATVLTTTIKRLNKLTHFSSKPTPPQPPRRRSFTVRMSSASTISPIEVCAKASVTKPNTLGDCPFSQRVLLTLEEKQLPYETKLVDLSNKPEWLLKANPDGKVPLIKLDEKWIPDSDVITEALEQKFPQPPLTTPPEKAAVGSKIFSTFIGFLKSKDPSDGTEEALINELTAFNDYIKDNGPFINGKEVSAADLSLGPKLYHMEVALGHYKKWSVPDSLPYLKSYMKSIFTRDSFVKTRALPEDVFAGWRPKVEG